MGWIVFITSDYISIYKELRNLYNLLCSSCSAIYAARWINSFKYIPSHYMVYDHSHFRFLPLSAWGGMQLYHHAIKEEKFLSSKKVIPFLQR